MNNFTYENQGTNTYLVYTLSENDIVDSMSLGMITNNKIPGIASTVFMQADEEKFIKYNVSSKVPVKQFFGGIVNKKRLLAVFRGIVEAMLSAEDYMIDHNMLLMDLEYIFTEVSTCETAMICVPIVSEDLTSKDLGMFFKTIMFSTQFDQTENCDHVTKIINYLNGTPTFSLVDFQKVLDEAERGAVAPAVNTVMTQPSDGVQNTIKTSGAPQTSVQPKVSVQPELKKISANEKVISADKSVVGQVKVPTPMTKAEEKKQDTSSEKPMSMFYLLQHYNKENAATYKAQKEAAKAKKEKKTAESKKEKKSNKEKGWIAPPPMVGGMTTSNVEAGFAIPGQSAVISNSETKESSVVKQSSAKDIAEPVKEKRSTSIQQLTQGPRQVEGFSTVEAPSTQPANFGETTVLNAAPSIGETTVLIAGAMQMEPMPHIIRSRYNEKVSVNKAVFRIGKEQSYVDYCIGDNTAISRSHANIITREGNYFIIDTNSTNHVYVNGQMIPCNQEVQIKDGDKIRLANEDFTFQLM